MSEYQCVSFRAIDAPVSEENLKFMQRQSSRATITPLAFDNEYHFGSFRGNAVEMLRRGYDIHLHYANFGVRRLMIRLPNGLPDAEAAKPYLTEESLCFLKDKQGPGGILSIEPYHEPGDLDDIWELNGFIDRLLPLRAEILDGDLRPLYLAFLAVASDGNHDPDEQKDAPVPAGLNKLTKAQRVLAELYGIDKALITAAARNSPPMPSPKDTGNPHAAWLARQPEAKKNEWLALLMGDPQSTVRREMIAEFQKSQNVPAWPTIRVNRTIAQINAASDEIQQDLDRKLAEEKARQRAAKLAEMAADPMRIIRETEDLVNQRRIDAYHKIAGLLADLREALSGTKQSGLPAEHARNLMIKNPNLRHLMAELRKQGFSKK